MTHFSFGKIQSKWYLTSHITLALSLTYVTWSHILFRLGAKTNLHAYVAAPRITTPHPVMQETDRWVGKNSQTYIAFVLVEQVSNFFEALVQTSVLSLRVFPKHTIFRIFHGFFKIPVFKKSRTWEADQVELFWPLRNSGTVIFFVLLFEEQVPRFRYLSVYT